MNYLDIYNLETYLFETVRNRFYEQGYLSAFDFFCIRVVVQLFSLLTQEWLFLPLGAAVRPLVTIN